MLYLIFLLLTSCAFKKEEAPPPPAPLFHGLTITWEADRPYEAQRHLAEVPGGYEAASPITFSLPVPEKLYIAGAPFLGENNYLESASATISGKDYSLAASIIEGRIEIVGIKALLPDDKDQAVDLVLKARNGRSGALVWTLTIHFLTLPTPVAVEAMPVSDFPRQFSAPGVRLDLVRVVRVKNDKARAVTLKFPGRWFKGHLQRSFTTYQLTRHKCRTDVAVSSRTDTYATKFVLLPLYDGLNNEWLKRAFEDGSDFEIPPDGELSVGLFGLGSALASFIDSGVPNVQAPIVEAPASCWDESCSDPPIRDRVHRFCRITHVESQRLKEGLEGGPVELVLADHLGYLAYTASVHNGKNPALRSVQIFPDISVVF
jgi:hypothetical protein